MQQKDTALIIFVTGISAIIAFTVGNFVLGGTDRSTDAEYVQAIDSSFILPSDRFFNETSFNPTTTIQIGDSTNPDPFADGTAPITEPTQ